MFEIAAENAAAKEYVRGPGSFTPALLDELWAIREQVVQGAEDWLAKTAKVHLVQV